MSVRRKSATSLKAAQIPGAVTAYQSEVLSDAPIFYLPLTETTNAWKDASGNGRNPTSSGNTALSVAHGLVPGDERCGLLLAYNGGYTTIADDAWMDVSYLTVEAVLGLVTMNNATGGIVSRDDESTNRSFRFNLASKKVVLLAFNASTSATCTGTTTLTGEGPWHVAGTFDGSNVRVYVNGTEEGSAPALSGTLKASAAALYVGRGAPTKYFLDSFVGHVAMYDHALSSTRIQAHAALVNRVV